MIRTPPHHNTTHPPGQVVYPIETPYKEPKMSRKIEIDRNTLEQILDTLTELYYCNSTEVAESKLQESVKAISALLKEDEKHVAALFKPFNTCWSK